MIESNRPSPHLPLKIGQLMSTPGAIHAMARCGIDPLELIERHRRGDSGDLSVEDKQSNDDALNCGARILSAYTIGDGVRIWIITEAGRATTTILCPEEY